jgi:hypothetical protein
MGRFSVGTRIALDEIFGKDTHNQQPVQQSERQSRNDKQVHRRNSIRMIVQEGLPALGWRPSPSRNVFGNAGLPYVDAALDEFAVYARCAPQRIGKAHLPDQLPDLGRHSGAAAPGPRLPAPVTPETCTMPSDHGLRPDDGQRFAGLRKQLAGPAQNHPVDGQEWRPTGPASAQHDDLLTQHEDLGFHGRARPEQIDHNRKNQSAEIHHPAEDHPILRLTPTGWNLR